MSGQERGRERGAENEGESMVRATLLRETAAVVIKAIEED